MDTSAFTAATASSSSSTLQVTHTQIYPPNPQIEHHFVDEGMDTSLLLHLTSLLSVSAHSWNWEATRIFKMYQTLQALSLIW